MKDENKKADFAIVVLLAFTMLFLMWGATSCKNVYVPVVEEHTKDSARVELKVDTFYQVVKDSVVVQMPCSDSIEVAYIDRWHTDYIYKVKEVHDTINTIQVDKEPQIVEVEKVVTKNSGFAKFCIALFVLALISAAAWIAFKVALYLLKR